MKINKNLSIGAEFLNSGTYTKAYKVKGGKVHIYTTDPVKDVLAKFSGKSVIFPELRRIGDHIDTYRSYSETYQVYEMPFYNAEIRVDDTDKEYFQSILNTRHYKLYEDIKTLDSIWKNDDSQFGDAYKKGGKRLKTYWRNRIEQCITDKLFKRSILKIFDYLAKRHKSIYIECPDFNLATHHDKLILLDIFYAEDQ